MSRVKPTNEKDAEKGEFYTLEDKDYLLIMAINNLAAAIRSIK